MGLFNGEKLFIGYDLENDFCQISYSISEKSEVETLSQVAGDQLYNIPAVLCKRPGVNQWFYGKEALRYEKEQNGILVHDLLAQALDGEPVLIEGESLQPVALLTLFVKRSLGLLSQVVSTDKITAVMFTSRVLDGRMLEVLNQVTAGLHLKTDRVFYQSHTESYYYYLIHQTQELWMHQALLLDGTRDMVRTYRMECNRRTTPIVAFIEEREYPFPEGSGEDMDRTLLQIGRECCEGENVCSVFLIGDIFDQDWMKESLRYFCRGRRVFQGNNLFSKGACYGALEKISPGEVSKSHVFLGNEKLKANVGLHILRQGEDSYYALLDAGENWYEAEYTFEFYIQGGNVLPLVITPLTGKSAVTKLLTLKDFSGEAARIRGYFYMESERVLIAELEDLGFGEIRAATGRQWKQKLELY